MANESQPPRKRGKKKRPTVQELMRRLTWWTHKPSEPDAPGVSNETLATLAAIGRATVTPEVQHTLALPVFNLLVMQARTSGASQGASLYSRSVPINPDALAEVLHASPETVKRALRVLRDQGMIEIHLSQGGGREVRILQDTRQIGGE